MAKHGKGGKLLKRLGHSLRNDLSQMKHSMRRNWTGKPMPVAGSRPKLPKFRRHL